jgi:hypothetical protein
MDPLELNASSDRYNTFDKSSINRIDNDLIFNSIQQQNETHINFSFHKFNWKHIIFVERDPIIEYSQLFIAIYGLFETLFYLYLTYNGNIQDRIFNAYFFIELMCTVPWIVEVSFRLIQFFNSTK